jgi:outer membrane protein
MIITQPKMKHLLLRTTIVVLILSIVPLQILAQQTEKLQLTLKEAQEFALQNNLQRKNAALDVEIASKKVWETTAMGLPQISSGVDFSFILSPLPKLSFPGPPGPDGVPTQMDISAGEKANATFNITATQLVFSGPYIVGLQASKAYKQLSENALNQSERDIKANVASAYYTVLLLSETSTILDSSVANLKQTYIEIQAMKNAGFVEEVVADQVKVSLSLVENSANEIGRQYHSALNLLKFHMGLENSEMIGLTESLDLLLDKLSLEPMLGLRLDPSQNLEMRIMENQVELSNLQLKLEKSNFLPSIAAFATYQRLAKEPEINFTPEAIAGFSLSLPIFSSGLRRSKVQQAKLEVEKSLNSYNNVRQSVEMDLADATAQYNTAWEKYKSQKENKVLAERVYNNYRTKYSNGMASQQDLIQANDKFLQTLGNYMGAVVELFNARLRVDKILGIL